MTPSLPAHEPSRVGFRRRGRPAAVSGHDVVAVRFCVAQQRVRAAENALSGPMCRVERAPQRPGPPRELRAHEPDRTAHLLLGGDRLRVVLRIVVEHEAPHVVAVGDDERRVGAGVEKLIIGADLPDSLAV